MPNPLYWPDKEEAQSRKTTTTRALEGNETDEWSRRVSNCGTQDNTKHNNDPMRNKTRTISSRMLLLRRPPYKVPLVVKTATKMKRVRGNCERNFGSLHGRFIDSFPQDLIHARHSHGRACAKSRRGSPQRDRHFLLLLGRLSFCVASLSLSFERPAARGSHGFPIASSSSSLDITFFWQRTRNVLSCSNTRIVRNHETTGWIHGDYHNCHTRSSQCSCGGAPPPIHDSKECPFVSPESSFLGGRIANRLTGQSVGVDAMGHARTTAL